MPKKYLVFSYPDYYPSGGWSDLLCKVDTLEEAYAEIIKTDHYYWEIVDAVQQEYIEGGLVFELKNRIKHNEE